MSKYINPAAVLLSLSGGGDSISPTLEISLSQYTFKIGDTATVTFTFSEEVMNFTVADITAPNGTLSSFAVTANPLIYTCTFTPSSSITDLTNIVTVGTSWTDLNGNSPENSTTSDNYEVDTVRPTVAITMSDYALSVGETSTITFTFSKAPTGFTSADVTAPNGTLSSFGVTGNPLIYTTVFTPTAGVSDATNVISVGTGWTDSAGNAPASSTDSSNYVVDTTAPTVTGFAATSPSGLTIAVTTFTASEAGVYFLITESSTPPLVGAAGWNLTAPATYVVLTSGTKVLYPWVKDSAGNISSVYGSPVSVIVPIFFDQFTTAEGAPIASPRTAEPGPGTLNLVQTGSNFSISSNKLQSADHPSTVWNVEAVNSAAVTRANGLTSFLTITPAATGGHLVAGFDKVANTWNPNNSKEQFIYFRESGLLTIHDGENNANVGTSYSSSVAYKTAVVLRSAGAFYFVKGGLFTEWTLIYVSRTGSTATLYTGLATADNAWTLDNMDVFALAAPFDSDYGYATARVASPGVGETITGTANAIVEMTWTAVTGQTWNLYVRRTDDNHTWAVRCDQGGSTIKLIEINGSETEWASAAQTFTNGSTYRIMIIMDGNTIQGVVNQAAAKWTYSSATYNNTETGIKSDRAGTNLISWPRVAAGSALSGLEGY
jgi:hypothetical protein